MRIHSVKKIERLKELRKLGYSINEIVKELSIPKTTIWHHIQGVDVLPEYVDLLKSKRGGGTKRKLERIEKAREKAKNMMKSLDRESLVALAMLYWSEGSKNSCDFINSDGRMVQLYLHIIRKVLKVPKKSLKMTLRIFTGMNETECLNYWSKITKTPGEEFFVRMNDGGVRGKTQYGLCRVSVYKGGDTLKLLHALVEQAYSELIKK